METITISPGIKSNPDILRNIQTLITKVEALAEIRELLANDRRIYKISPGALQSLTKLIKRSCESLDEINNYYTAENLKDPNYLEACASEIKWAYEDIDSTFHKIKDSYRSH
jgi:hypothetical protein